MSDDNVFNTPTGGNNESALGELVGEGKKFATIEDLAKGKLEADTHIQRLEGEATLTREQIGELQKKAEKNVTLSELMETMKKANKGAEEGGNPSLDTDSLSKMVKEIMDGEHESQTKSENRRTANSAVLDKVNGDVEAARSYVAERAKQLGMSVEQVQALGEDSPSAFRTLMGIDPSTRLPQPGVTQLPGQAPPRDTATVIEGHHTKAYYDALKKEMGAVEYWTDDKLQKQYYADAFALGTRFN